MNSDHWKTGYEAFEKEVNLDLFHAAFALAAKTSTNEDAMSLYYEKGKQIIWFEGNFDEESYLAPYGLRYLGEVLERYQECFGAEIRNTRALALAIGYAAPFLTEDMFIGRQKTDFLRRLDREEGWDVYLFGARYLRTENSQERKELLRMMMEYNSQRTEETTFILSLFEDKNEGYEVMRAQLSAAWGDRRTISLLPNVGILEWMTAQYKDVIKGCRKKESTVLRALMKLPYMFVKNDSPVYLTLSKTGYGKLEIAYANSQAIWQGAVRDRLDYNGIPAEKIAAEFGMTLINSTEPFDEDRFFYLESLLVRYSRFSVKYQGYEGMWEAIRDSLRPTQPQTLLWMIENIDKDFPVSFDVFDPQWDILAQKLGTEKYYELFSEQLIRNEVEDAEGARKWIERYQELTGINFCSDFEHRSRWNRECFALLIKYGVIDLWSFFKEHVSQSKEENENSIALDYLESYIKAISTREAFDFYQALLEDYDYTELNDIFGHWYKFHDGLVRDLSSGSYYSRDVKLDFQRDFLNPEEQKQVLEWMDESVFRMEPEKYLKFVKAALRDQYVLESYEREELCPILKELLAAGAISGYEETELKKVLFTPEDFAADQAEKEAQKKADKLRAEQEEWDSKKKKLLETYDGTFSSLREYEKKFWYREDKQKALSLIYDQLADSVIRTEKPASPIDMGDFLQLCGIIVERNALPWERIYPLVEMMTREGIKC